MTEHKKIAEVGYNPEYLYFNVGNIIYRIKKEFMLKHKILKDKVLTKKVRERNRKLREKVFIIPLDVYLDTHIFRVKRDGNLYDVGMYHPKFDSGEKNIRFSNKLSFDEAQRIYLELNEK